MTRTASAATRTLEGVRVVVSVSSDEHSPDELSELVRLVLLHAESVCIKLYMRRRAIERLAARIRSEWREDFESEAAE